jgi:ribosomal protein S25
MTNGREPTLDVMGQVEARQAQLLAPLRELRAEVQADLERVTAQVAELRQALKRIDATLHAAAPPEPAPAGKRRGQQPRKGVSQETLEAVLETLPRAQAWTASEMGDVTGMAAGTARLALEQLRERGLVRVVGRRDRPGMQGKAPIEYAGVTGG